jgi:hypothetical protein
MFFICAAQYSSHLPHVATKYLKCGWSINAGEDAGKKEPSYIGGRNVN